MKLELKTNLFVAALIFFSVLSTTAQAVGSVIKIDWSSNEAVTKALALARAEYQSWCSSNGLVFKLPLLSPATALLFLSTDDKGEKIKIKDDKGGSAHLLVHDAVKTAVEKIKPLSFDSPFEKITHFRKSPYGVPNLIEAGTSYHPVSFEFPNASTHLTDLVNALTKEVDAVVTRDARDQQLRIGILIGYVVGADETVVLDVPRLPSSLHFDVDHVLLDFPGRETEGFKDLRIDLAH